MSGIMDWVKNTIGLTDEEENSTEEAVKETATVPARRRSAADDIPVPSSSSKRSKVVNINTTAQLKVVVVQPLSYNDAPEIADHLKSKKPVVVNLESLEKSVASKIFDFLSGAVFALDGSMQKVSSGILLIVPNTMGIMGDFSDELKTQGIFDAF
ncbi:MAG: cell division protein SepF [Clostridia bacterium]|nr:cell division protein SepF [Clostridia bacterium]